MMIDVKELIIQILSVIGLGAVYYLINVAVQKFIFKKGKKNSYKERINLLITNLQDASSEIDKVFKEISDTGRKNEARISEL